MTDLSTYELEQLRDDGNFVLSRGTRRGGKPESVLVISTVLEDPAPWLAARMDAAYALREHLDGAPVAMPLELVEHDGRRRLLIADPGGELLEGVIGRPMELPRFLRMAMGIAAALGDFHARGLIHKDIKPANILVDERSGEAWLAEVSLSSRVPRHRQAAEAPEVIAGTLQYMAPEQTGRMNRSIDSRSDLYSLGVTFYEMLVGALPFTASDPMEWVHCHIARRAIPPSERVNGIPEALSAVVMKLLAKTAEDRYQTAAGVEADLRRCLAEWENTGWIEAFAPGGNDTADRLLIPERLYGREREIEMLLGAFDRVVSRGTTRLMLVSGYSGVGKSSVVNELHKALVPPRGLFASGKFDQFKRDIPYATLAQAFQRLIQQILIRSDAEVAMWREALEEALGMNGQLIVNLIPELELIIGEQAPVQELPPQETKNRFQTVLRRFIGVFASADHPLALFLDDLQWLDAATLDLLEYLLTEPEMRHLMIVGAYRDNEVGPEHPLMRTLGALRAGGAIIDEIVLAPLGLEDLNAAISDSLHASPETTRLLAQLLHEKTGGNPFFAIQFFTMLADEGLLAFDPDSRGWKWDLGRIRAKGYTDNVVVLMGRKLNWLSTGTLEMLQIFACLGNVSEVAMLAMVSGETEEGVQAILAEAVESGLVLEVGGTYSFLHDRVQEAAYALIPVGNRPAMHLKIGSMLAARTPADEVEEFIFEIVNQLNRGAALIETADEREQTAALNLRAARRAKGATAYTSALNYVTAGLAMLPEETWERRYELQFQMEFLRADCEFLTGQLGLAEANLLMLARRAANIVDRAAVTWLQVTLYTALDRSDRAIEICFEFLRGVGIDWPMHPSREDVEREYEQIWEQLGDRAIEEIVDLPLVSDPAVQATIDVLTALQPAALYMDANLNCIVVSRMVNLSLQHGNCDASCYAYIIFSMILGPQFGAYAEGFRFGKVAFDLVEEKGLERFKARVLMCFGNIVSPWTRHASIGRPLVRRAFAAAQESGDLTFAVYSCHNLVTNLLVCGVPLDEVQREAEGGIEFSRKARISLAVDFITGQMRLIMSLRGLLPEFGCFNDGTFDESVFESHLEENPSLSMATCWYWIRKLQAKYHANDYPAAIAAAAKAERLLWTSPSFLEVCDFHFYAALARAAYHDAISEGERGGNFEALLAHRKEVAIGAANCAANFENRQALIDAEIARIEGRSLEAMALYEEAIRSAHANGFVNNEGMAGERAASFYEGRGLHTATHGYLRGARQCFARWGALGKVQQLEQRHPFLREERTVTVPDVAAATTSGQLDLATVVKMSQAVSGEIVLDRLIERLMVMAMEHAGAGRGLLLLPKGEEYRVEAEATTGHDGVTVSSRAEAVRTAARPESILRYVIRSHESVILDDALLPNPFSEDEYIARAKPRSVLCLPLVKQGKLVGVLYLENALSSYVFTPARITVLQLLVLQAAISLKNARLYLELQQAEENTRRRERDFRLAFDTIPSLAWTALPDGRVESLNKQCSDYTGIPPEKMVVDWHESYHPDDLWRVVAKWNEILETGKTGEVEARMRRADGEYRWFLVRATPLHDEEGNIVRWYGTNTDIEDRKRAEGLLAGEKRVLDVIARGDSLPAILDEFCRVVDELAEGTRSSILVYDKEGNCLRHGAAPGLPTEYTQAVDGAAISAKGGSCGTAVFRGEKVFVSDIRTDPLWENYRDAAPKHGLRACWSMPIMSRDGGVLGAFALYADRARNISPRENSIVEQFSHLASIALERKRAEEALLKSEKFLAQGQSISHTGSWAWKISTGRVLWSEEHCRIFGAPPDQKETTFEGFISRVHPDDREFVMKTLEEAMCAKGDFNYEYRILLPDGTLKYAHGRGCGICVDGRLDEYIGTTMDITERKRAEEELQRSEASLRKAQAELAHVTRVTTMGELAASIAHEVNQPLAGIVMNGNAALRWLAGLKGDSIKLHEAREAITRIIRDGNRAGEVIGRIRSLFKKAETAREPLDVNEMVREVIVLARGEMDRRRVALRLELAEGLPAVMGDRVQLQQVTLNLILNGIEAMSKIPDRRRELMVRTEARDQERVGVVIQDNGVGLDPQTMDKIFEAFHTTKNGGLGMGLSISRSIIENHSGRLWAEPNTGPGATFQFVLAKAEEQ